MNEQLINVEKDMSRSLIITGPCGSGKTRIATALAIRPNSGYSQVFEEMSLEDIADKVLRHPKQNFIFTTSAGAPSFEGRRFAVVDVEGATKLLSALFELS